MNPTRILRRWSLQLSKYLGVHLESQLIIVIGIATLLCVQVILYMSLCSQTFYCHLPNMRSFHHCHTSDDYEKLPMIYVVTPTYARHVQKAELTRLSHTFMLVPNLHWIIVEDSDWSTDLVSKLVRRLKNSFDFHTITQLQAKTPDTFKLKPGDSSWKYPKGVWQRNKALQWIRENFADLDCDGVIYFADDDNTYDLELFNEMRYTRVVSVWPVGLVGGLLVERPIVGSSAKVESFNSVWAKKRPFPIDMAGFAISIQTLMNNPNASFSANNQIGYLESHFLSQLVRSWSDLEPKADQCNKVLVWHTKTQKPQLHEEKKLKIPSDSGTEL